MIPPIPEPISGGLTAALPVVGSLINGISGLFGRKAQDRRAIKFWNMQNEYNHPSAQMKRLQEAGLNPNMIYGNTSTSVSGNSTPIKAPEREKPFSIDNPLQNILLHHDIQQRSAQTDNFKIQNDVLLEEAELKRTQQALNNVNAAAAATKNATGQLEYEKLKALQNDSIDAARVAMQRDKVRLMTEESDLNLKRGLDAQNVRRDTAIAQLNKLRAETNNTQIQSAINEIKHKIWATGRNPNLKETWEDILTSSVAKHGKSVIDWIRNGLKSDDKPSNRHTGGGRSW